MMRMVVEAQARIALLMTLVSENRDIEGRGAVLELPRAR